MDAFEQLFQTPRPQDKIIPADVEQTLSDISQSLDDLNKKIEDYTHWIWRAQLVAFHTLECLLLLYLIYVVTKP